MNKMYFLTLSVLPIHLFLDVDCRFLISMSQKKFNKFTFLGLFAELLTFMVEIGNFLRPFQHQSMYKTQSSGSESFFLCKKTVPALSNSWSTASDQASMVVVQFWREFLELFSRSSKHNRRNNPHLGQVSVPQ